MLDSPDVEIVKDTPNSEEQSSDVTDIISADLAKASDNIGNTLAKLRSQVEAGITFNEEGVQVYDSMDNLPQETRRYFANDADIISTNELPPLDSRSRGYRDENTGESIDVGGMRTILEANDVVYKDKGNLNVKLVRNGENIRVVTEQSCGPRLKIYQIMGTEFPPTEEYEQYLRDFSEGKERQRPLRTEENYLLVQHLIFEDTVTGKVFDARSLLPDDWEMRYVAWPENKLAAFGQDFDDQYVSYGNLMEPALIFGLLHEQGHNLYTANDDPELSDTAKELYARSKTQLGGSTSLPPDVYEETKRLLVANERGASAHAFQIIRILREKGIDLGVSTEELANLAHQALISYEKGYPGGETRFLRPDLQQKRA
jgi:hypothetical protein